MCGLNVTLDVGLPDVHVKNEVVEKSTASGQILTMSCFTD